MSPEMIQRLIDNCRGEIKDLAAKGEPSIIELLRPGSRHLRLIGLTVRLQRHMPIAVRNQHLRMAAVKERKRILAAAIKNSYECPETGRQSIAVEELKKIIGD